MSDVTTTIDTYLEAYGEPDAARRLGLIREVWAADGHLVDPPLDGRGHDGIDAMFAAVQGQFAGHRFRRTTGVDAHHDFARYGWELVSPDGAVSLGGMDVAELDADGKLVRVVGFMGDFPARDA
ncbi:MAG: nuclear transport factor 2 family protein [Acidimicrobiia bacterium]|nr:nuclear transport factor 2 family protein [Acidimicrobiia bacterium]